MSIDRIGLLFDAAPTPEGEPVELAGWHVNLTLEAMAVRPDLAAHVVTPTRLRRTWAGDDPAAPTLTAPLRFADAAQADALLGALLGAD